MATTSFAWSRRAWQTAESARPDSGANASWRAPGTRAPSDSSNSSTEPAQQRSEPGSGTPEEGEREQPPGSEVRGVDPERAQREDASSRVVAGPSPYADRVMQLRSGC